jgi:hypothetical protein
MVVQAPPPTSAPDPAIEDGVIEDARRRQRRQRRIGAVLLSVVAACALVAGLAVGGGGAGGGTGGGATPSAGPTSGSPGSGAGHANANTALAGAPVTQRNSGVYTNVCPLAAPSRYLPARAGCVTVRRLDMTGDGRRDLVILYSVLGHRHAWWYSGGPPASIAKDFVPLRAYLKVVLPDGRSTAIRITPKYGSSATLLDASAHVNSEPGAELFLLVDQISSGTTAAAYGFDDGRLVAAGVPLYYGGDSGAKAGFNCVSGSPPRIVQRTYGLIGGSLDGPWKEISTVFAWHGPKLVQASRRTFNRRGEPTKAETAIGRGCTHGIG